MPDVATVDRTHAALDRLCIPPIPVYDEYEPPAVQEQDPPAKILYLGASWDAQQEPGEGERPGASEPDDARRFRAFVWIACLAGCLIAWGVVFDVLKVLGGLR